MAYRADIEIAVKGAQELKRLQDQVRATSKLVDGLNNYLENIGAGGAVRSINNLNKSVADTAAAFNKVALGTDEATLAARNFVAANRQLTQGLEERLALVKSITEQERRQRLGSAGIRETTQYGGPIGPGPASSVGSLVGQTSPVAEKINRALQAKKDELELQAGLLRLEQKSAAVLNEKLELQQRLNRAALEQGKRDVQLLSLQQAQRQQFLAGASGSIAQGPLAGPGAMGFPVALSLTKVEQQALEIAAKKQEILQRTVTTRKALVGLAANLQRLDQNSAVAIADAVRSQDQLNAAKARQLALTQQIQATEAAASRAARQRLAEESARRDRIQNAGFGIQGPALPPRAGSGRGGTGGSNLGGAISSGLIGGGFPLLFGQGPAAAAGGALGGVAGGLLGGGFGFALSIVGTALGDAVTKAEAFNKSLSTLNAGLSTTGSISITTAGDVGKLASSLSVTKDEAIELLNTFKQFRDGDTREALATLFAPVGGAATFEAIAKAGIDEKNALSAIFSLRKEIGNDAATQLALQLRSVGATATQSKLLEIVLDRSIEITVAQASQVKFTDRLLSIWEGIIAGLAQAVSLAARFIAKIQEGSFIKLPFLDKIASVLGGVTGRTPEQITQQNADKLLKELKAERDKVRAALATETQAFALENTLGESYKTGTKPPEDRTTQLRADFEAIKGIAEAEDKIRDLLFEGKEIKAAQAETDKIIKDIERDRVKALESANYESERMVINKIAEIRGLKATLEEEDKIRAVKQKKFEEELQIQEAVRSSVQVFTDMRKERELDLQYSKTYSRLLMEGVLPAEAARIANFEKTVAAQLQTVELQLQTTQAAILEAQARGLSTVELQKQLDILRAKQKAIAGEAAKGPGAAPSDKERLQIEADRVRGELNTLIDPINMVKTAAEGIGSAFANSFKGIIDGSLSAKEALAGFFQSVADQFLDMASQIIAKMIEMFILKTALNIFGGAVGGGGGFSAGGAGFGGSNSFSSFDAGGAFAFSSPSFFAKGGFVTGPTNAVIGEGGESEYVIPSSKMQSAMARYGSGARGNAVLAGGGAGGGAAASGPIVVEVRASMERINSVDYVTADQFQAGIQQAAQQGAAQGERRTLQRLQQSPTTRRRVGVG